MSGSPHPIKEGVGELNDRVRLLEVHLARLWDQVWWMNLPPERREQYKAEGFTDPITNFYDGEDAG
jgi:hypothetical protein